MKLSCTITEFILDPHPTYGSFVVEYKDGKEKRKLLVRGFAEVTRQLEEGKDYVMHLKIESNYWPESKKYSTSAFLLRANKARKFNPNAGFDRRGLDRALWKNEGK